MFPLAQVSLPRERGRLRFHALQNVQTALDLLKYKNIRLVNIRPDEIVDGNPKLTLGLIWTIILHFQVRETVILIFIVFFSFSISSRILLLFVIFSHIKSPPDDENLI